MPGGTEAHERATQLAEEKRLQAEREWKRMEAVQADEMARLREDQAKQQRDLSARHDARYRKGLLGLFDRLIGRRKRIGTENRDEERQLQARHRDEFAHALLVQAQRSKLQDE